MQGLRDYSCARLWSSQIPLGAAVKQASVCIRYIFCVLQLRGIWDLFFLIKVSFPMGVGTCLHSQQSLRIKLNSNI